MDESSKKNDIISDSELAILINEYNICNERIESFLKRQDIILQISMIIIGGALSFTIINTVIDELFLVLPLIPLILFIHILYHYTRVMSNQGYREYLQITLNKYLKKEEQIKYSSISKEFLLQKNPISKINTVLFPSIMITMMLYSIIMSNYNLIVVLGNILILIIIIIIVIKFLKFTSNLNEKIKNFCINN